jgi:uncharacterized membrane protein YgcG
MSIQPTADTLTSTNAPAGTDVRLTKFEQYPAEEPTGWAVGFTVEMPNGASKYRDVTVAFDAADLPTDPTEEDIVAEAWGRIGTSFTGFIRRQQNRASMRGAVLEWDGSALTVTTPSGRGGGRGGGGQDGGGGQSGGGGQGGGGQSGGA